MNIKFKIPGGFVSADLRSDFSRSAEGWSANDATAALTYDTYGRLVGVESRTSNPSAAGFAYFLAPGKKFLTVYPNQIKRRGKIREDCANRALLSRFCRWFLKYFKIFFNPIY